MNVRELRLALQEKLEHRRDLMRDNYTLRTNLDTERSRNKFLLDTVANPLVNRELERCADQIIQEVLDRAIKASGIVADQSVEDGHYEIGISIPSLHIRRRLFRQDVAYARDIEAIDSRHACHVKRIDVSIED